MRSVSRNVFSKKQLYKKVPILDWLPKYDVQTGVSDLIAGVTVGLTVIPQGIAYALIAKLPPQVRSFYFIFPYDFDFLRKEPKRFAICTKTRSFYNQPYTYVII